MSKHIKKFIDKKYEELNQKSDDEYTTITVRLAPKDALMLKAIATGLNFPISTSFSKIISKNIYDMAISLNDKDFEEFLDRFYSYDYVDTYWIKEMVNNGLFKGPSFDSYFQRFIKK